MYNGQSGLVETAMAMICIIVVVVGGLLLLVSFLSAVTRLLRRIDSGNRRIEPSDLWLNLIPIFNFVWAVVTVERIAESIRNEYISRGLDGPREKYGRTAGLTVLVLLASGVLFYPAVITYPIAFIYAIVYWSQLNRYTRELKSSTYRPPPIDEGW